jgi:NhaP-type Na+/H+ or K+/H+ antiporter
VTLLGQRIDLLSLHQASFLVFAVAAGLHVLARFVPAVALATERGHRDDGRLRGRGPRIAVLVAALAAGALAAALILPAAAPWRDEHRDFFPGGPPPPGFSHG